MVLVACALTGEGDLAVGLLTPQDHDNYDEGVNIEEVALVVQAYCLQGEWEQAWRVLGQHHTKAAGGWCDRLLIGEWNVPLIILTQWSLYQVIGLLRCTQT